MHVALQGKFVSVAFSIHGNYPQPMFLVSSAQEVKVTKKSGVIKILELKTTFEPVYLMNDKNRTLAITYFSAAQKALVFSPEQPAKSLVILCPFSTIKPEANRSRFLKTLNEAKHKADLQNIIRSFDKTGIITTDRSIELTTRLSMKISQEMPISH